MKFRIEQFKGMIPKVATRLLPDRNAAAAYGCSLASGLIQPVAGAKKEGNVPAGTKTIHKHNGNWMYWPGEVDVANGPVAHDEHDRIYWSGDGAPKVSGVAGAERKTFDLGVPAPSKKPSVQTQSKSVAEITWTQNWHYQYEEPDGSVTQQGDLEEGNFTGNNVNLVTPGQIYRMAGAPVKGAGVSAEAVFVVYFDAYTDSEVRSYLGRCYSNVSLYKKQNDLYVDGAVVSMTQTTSISGIQLNLDYDTSRASEFTKSRVYVYSYITAFGEEGPPSAPSSVIEVLPTKNVQLSQLSAPPVGHNITSIRIYRTNETASGTIYRMVGEVSSTKTTYIDSTIDADLLNVLESSDWNPPPEGLQGFGLTAGGVAYGFSGRTVHFSEPYLPHAWPAKYEFEAYSDIVAVMPIESGVAVLTKDRPELLLGDSPESLQRMRLPTHQGCVSRRAAMLHGGGVVYASPDGIAMLSGMGVRLLSEPFLEREQWQALDPENMVGAVFDSQLLFYSPAGGLVVELNRGELVFDDSIRPKGFYQDLDADTLYCTDGVGLYQWRKGDLETARWKSKTFVFRLPTAPRTLEIHATGYPVMARWYADGEVVANIPITSVNRRKLPVFKTAESWAIEVEGGVAVERIEFNTGGRE